MARRPRNPDFAEEETAIEKVRARDDLARKNELQELREILLDEKVRKFLWRMLSKAGMYRTHFNPNAAIMGHNTGLADMGTAILNEVLEANPEAWIVMQQDAYRKQMDEILLEQSQDQSTTEE
jgi:hypothetical protein